MNRNVLKIMAVISMALDHVGAFLLPSWLWLRWVGRLAFPIFAFFIAEGLRYTKSRKRYVLTLLIFAFVSQIPYTFLGRWYELNILFTFLFAILIIYLIESYSKYQTVKLVSLIFLGFALIVCSLFGIIDYGVFGVLLILVFYFVKDRGLSLALGSVCLALLTFRNLLLGGFIFINTCQFASLLGIALLRAYDGSKGRVNLKWLFYVFYPVHLAIICVIAVLI